MAVSHRGAISFGLVKVLVRHDNILVNIPASVGISVSNFSFVPVTVLAIATLFSSFIVLRSNSNALSPLASGMANTMVKDFEPSLYKYEYQVKLREIIEQKIAGKDIKASAPEVQVNAIDIKVTDLTLTERKALLQKAIKSEDGRN